MPETTPNFYLADRLVALHLCFVAFVVVGQLLILAGWPIRWRWVRRHWPRRLLVALAVLEALALVSAGLVHLDFLPSLTIRRPWAVTLEPETGFRALLLAIDTLALLGGMALALLVGSALLRYKLGRTLHWTWVRNFWFRVVHLGCIAFVAGEGMLNIFCPLTRWEETLRGGAGHLRDVATSTWIGTAANRILFYEGNHVWFQRGHIAFGALVLLTFLLCPPRFPRLGIGHWVFGIRHWLSPSRVGAATPHLEPTPPQLMPNAQCPMPPQSPISR